MIGFLYFCNLFRGVASAAFIGITTPTGFLVWCALKIGVYPFSRKLYNYGDECFYSLYQRMILFLAEEISGVQIIFYGEIDKFIQEKESGLILFNHQCTIDWLLASSLALRRGSVGSVRYILKHSLKYIPFYGVYLKAHGCVYIERKQYDSKKTTKQLSCYPTMYKKFLLVLFPEGTRYSNKSSMVFKRSQEYALAHGLPTFDHVLVPRVKGFETCLNSLSDSIHFIYDITIAYKCFSDESNNIICSKRVPSLMDLFNGECKEIHIDVRCFDADKIKADHHNIQDWLMNRFENKDKLMKKFHEKNELFDERSMRKALTVGQTLPAFLLFFALDIILLGTAKGRKLYTFSFVTGFIISTLSWTLKS
ncbi:hypothetical protein HELRODRAFT_77464 [Helobdella robusta]|uniref:Phospholipid/glycerol acyltransferase domain-containing protein n=1 Tax=Helobdella robusta TaxID=6412 RepID=T1G2Y2_HELRO|nr:hypothetical protein HELRODRAFT_77464 [Helobdella robusta]ESO05768.1 hypothetical protein HELRODRAFT_77464 [Helobdella robusta]